MMYEMIKTQMMEILPFVRHNFIQLEEVGEGTARGSLPERDELKNHIGSQHAAAMFGLGETVSGAAMAGLLGPKFLEVRPVAATANIAYKKVARGQLVATGQAQKTREELFADLDGEGKSRLNVVVSLCDGEGDEVATMTVEWYVSRKRS